MSCYQFDPNIYIQIILDSETVDVDSIPLPSILMSCFFPRRRLTNIFLLPIKLFMTKTSL